MLQSMGSRRVRQDWATEQPQRCKDCEQMQEKKLRQWNVPKKVIQIYSLIPEFKEDPTVLNILRFSEVHLSLANTFPCAQTA